MLKLQKKKAFERASASTVDMNLENMLETEWLLTNARGAYSSSTLASCNTRRYHGLLIGTVNPPVNRIMALSSFLETIVAEDRIINLSTFEFPGKISPMGSDLISSFSQDTGVHFQYNIDSFDLTKSIYLAPHSDTVAVVYDFKMIRENLELLLRPFVGLRDFHSLQNSSAKMSAENEKNSVLISHRFPGSLRLLIQSEDAEFKTDPQWWYNFIYRKEKERHQDFKEDLWTPGFFKASIGSPCKIIVWASLNAGEQAGDYINYSFDSLTDELNKKQEKILGYSETKDQFLKKLMLAADQFIIKPLEGIEQADEQLKHRTSILAGFPWFVDWGRDACISLPGLLLSTGRHEDAKEVLVSFANTIDQGMIPNRFDDRADIAHFNSIDASLWFINAVFDYHEQTEDLNTFQKLLLPAVISIVDAYQKGTRFGIVADEDGLITGGDDKTQLTWMDAKFDDTVFTPRHGKAVEINALWYNALCRIALYYAEKDVAKARKYHEMADKVEESFNRKFWNETTSYLNDCIHNDGQVDYTLRPNQIFAVSLPFSPLSDRKQLAVLNAVRENLLTDYGLRTLDPKDPRYHPRYEGTHHQRDGAYHQGTVWPYLIGPFIEAYLKTHNYSSKSRRRAERLLGPLKNHMEKDGCLGSISEIFDGDPPQLPRGCFGQAWSVGEFIRAYKLINS